MVKFEMVDRYLKVEADNGGDIGHIEKEDGFVARPGTAWSFRLSSIELRMIADKVDEIQRRKIGAIAPN